MPRESRAKHIPISNTLVHSESKYCLIKFDVQGLKSMKILLVALRPAHPQANQCMPWITKLG